MRQLKTRGVLAGGMLRQDSANVRSCLPALSAIPDPRSSGNFRFTCCPETGDCETDLVRFGLITRLASRNERKYLSSFARKQHRSVQFIRPRSIKDYELHRRSQAPRIRVAIVLTTDWDFKLLSRNLPKTSVPFVIAVLFCVHIDCSLK